MLQSRLLADTVQIRDTDHVLILNSAADPFVVQMAEHTSVGSITLAEDNVAAAQALQRCVTSSIRHVAFHNYILQHQASNVDLAIMDLLYQPGNTWMYYGLQVALYALRPGGYLYVVGAKDRGILSTGKRMQELFGNLETLTISKGHRVLRARKITEPDFDTAHLPQVSVFADSQLDEGTRLLRDSLDVKEQDEALDIGCGAGFIGLYVAHRAPRGQVTMVDVSLAAVDAAQQAVAQSGLGNIRVLPSDAAGAVLDQRFDLVVTNPPFHQGGVQTLEIAERFIRQAAQVLRPHGRFYLVANRFLKYEPTIHACFKHVDEVAGNTRYKVLRAM
jgi:16S rRNA (guanine1207-N2)-methyltransferase